MFTGSAFQSWPLILLGGLFFSGLFGVAAFMGDALLLDRLSNPASSASLVGVAAFAGYIGVAMIIRLEEGIG